MFALKATTLLEDGIQNLWRNGRMLLQIVLETSQQTVDADAGIG
jgi:hypothetical protein